LSSKARRNEITSEVSSETDLRKWGDWRWQVSHCVKDIDTVEKILDAKYEAGEKKALEETIEKFPISVTPYYMSLIDTEDFRNDPVYKQSIPDPQELDVLESDMSDPLAEDKDSPVDAIVHRYPDRVLFLVANVCSMYCRHCTRKRKVGDVECIPSRKQMSDGIEYIRGHPQVRDVLLSGGDPLMLSDGKLEWILKELRSIEHVEIIRIGTRMPVVLPYRITQELVDMISQYQPVWVNTHFNHPREITKQSKRALARLAGADIPLGNQSVLLSGVNDCPRIMKSLVHKLVANRVRPYYLFQCDLSEGLTHFRTPVSKGIEIIENLIGHTTGFAVPRYVIDAPGGGGKIPVMPNYVISRGTNKVVLRNFEGVITTYKEPDSYEPTFCDRNCAECNLQLKLDEAWEHEPVGIARLLDYGDESISLTPRGNDRIRRRRG